MRELVEKVRAAIDAAPWIERRDSFGTMHDTRAEARAAIAAVAEWLDNQIDLYGESHQVLIAALSKQLEAKE